MPEPVVYSAARSRSAVANSHGPADSPCEGKMDAQNPRPTTITMLVHSVYFWLKPELTPAQRADFRRGAESLATIKSVEKLYVGVPAGVPDRPVVDKSFGVALTVICRDVAAHNAYQVDPVHLAFIERWKSYWARVQIYDAE
jgi:hypothetical protein